MMRSLFVTISGQPLSRPSPVANPDMPKYMIKCLHMLLQTFHQPESASVGAPLIAELLVLLLLYSSFREFRNSGG